MYVYDRGSLGRGGGGGGVVAADVALFNTATIDGMGVHMLKHLLFINPRDSVGRNLTK